MDSAYHAWAVFWFHPYSIFLTDPRSKGIDRLITSEPTLDQGSVLPFRLLHRHLLMCQHYWSQIGQYGVASINLYFHPNTMYHRQGLYGEINRSGISHRHSSHIDTIAGIHSRTLIPDPSGVHNYSDAQWIRDQFWSNVGFTAVSLPHMDQKLSRFYSLKSIKSNEDYINTI